MVCDLDWRHEDSTKSEECEGKGYESHRRMDRKRWLTKREVDSQEIPAVNKSVRFAIVISNS